MARFDLLLLCAVLATAMLTVNFEYRSRRLFTELDRANTEARRIEIDNDRLQLEKRAQATPSRVESLAKDQLQMRTSTPAITQYVDSEGAIAAGQARPQVQIAGARLQPLSVSHVRSAHTRSAPVTHADARRTAHDKVRR